MVERRKAYKFSALKKAKVLELLAQGMRRYKAMEAVGLNGGLFSYACAADPEFAAQVDLAEMMADQDVEDALREGALNGNVTAEIFWLCNRRPDRWQHVQRRAQQPGDTPETPLYIAPVESDGSEWDHLSPSQLGAEFETALNEYRRLYTSGEFSPN